MPAMTQSTIRLHVALLLLSFGAGAADAFAFLALNGTFTANMTGNLVLAALFTRPEFARTLICALVAVVVFAAVLYAGFLTTRSSASAPNARRQLIRRLLIPSVVVQSAVVVVWFFRGEGGDPPLITTCAVIGLSAGALALQTVAAKKLSDIGGITTTYVTGTLTTTMQALAERKGHGQRLRALSILALPGGALACTALIHVAPTAGPALVLAMTIAATGVALSAVIPDGGRSLGDQP